MNWNNMADFSKLDGHTIRDVYYDHEEIRITTDTHIFTQSHQQDCCERVLVDEIVGDLEGMIGEKVLAAWEETNREDQQGKDIYDSFTWTFYTIRTNTRTVVIRWLGESNGYYSEAVQTYMEPLKVEKGGVIVTAGQDFAPKGTEVGMQKRDRWNHNYVKLNCVLIETAAQRDEVQAMLLTTKNYLRERRYDSNADVAVTCKILEDMIEDLRP